MLRTMRSGDAKGADLNVHNVSCADLVEADFEPIWFALHGRCVTPFLRLLEGKRWALEVRGEFCAVVVLQR